MRTAFGKHILKVILCISAAFFTHNLFGKTIEVGSKNQFFSVSAAIEAVDNGDSIVILKGVYKESDLLLKKSITLISYENAEIDFNHEYGGIQIASNNVHLEGLVISNIAISYIRDNAAIRLTKSDHCTIINNTIKDAFFGIYLEKSDSNLIQHNHIQGTAREEANSGNAIHLWYSNDNIILKNHCEGHRDGIYIEFSSNCRMISNTSKNNIRYGLHFMFSDGNIYEDNLFERNNAGAAVMYSTDIVMKNNRFLHNWGSASYGLLLKEIKDSRLYGNTFEQNSSAVYAEGVVRLKVDSNRFVQNGWAMKVRGDCEYISILHNEFISNTFDMATNSNNAEHVIKQNFWSSYTGYDLDNDGLGDVPFYPMSLFCYIVENNPSAVVLIRSSFIDLLNFAEKITPVITPASLVDESPLMKQIL